MDDIPGLSQYHVPGTDAAYYIPNFVSVDEEAYLLRKIHETPPHKWRQLANRRLQTWGGDLTPKNTLIPQPMPSFLSDYPALLARLAACGAFSASPYGRPNHVILNEYLPGQGIMPHEDGPSYHPTVATLSLGAHAVLEYFRYAPGGGGAVDRVPALALLLEPRSLVVTQGALYTAHLHGIAERAVDVFVPQGEGDTRVEGVRVTNAGMLAEERARAAVRDGGTLVRGTRYSLTCRDVARVSGIGPRILQN